MRKLVALCGLLGLLAVTSCAATFNIQFTMPTQDNTGTCLAPTLVPTAGGLVRAKLQYGVGNLTAAQLSITAYRDSMSGAPGTAGGFSGNIASNTYTFMVTCFDSLGNSSCGATITKLIRGSFSEVQNLR